MSYPDKPRWPVENRRMLMIRPVAVNRNPKAYALAILGAEYILGLLPKGTHDYAKLIKPSELETWSRGQGLRFEHMEGMHYNPMTQSFTLGGNVDVNYIVHTIKDDA